MSSTTKGRYANYVILLMRVLSNDDRNVAATLVNQVRNRLSSPANLQSNNENVNDIIVKNIKDYMKTHLNSHSNVARDARRRTNRNLKNCAQALI